MSPLWMSVDPDYGDMVTVGLLKVRALAKDGGCTPATLAWLLSEITVPEGVRLPTEVSPAELRAYIAGLIERLLVLAVSGTSSSS